MKTMRLFLQYNYYLTYILVQKYIIISLKSNLRAWRKVKSLSSYYPYQSKVF